MMMVETDGILGAIQKIHPAIKLGQISVQWLSDDELLEVNKQFLNHDYYTDIITFDYSRGTVIKGELLISTDRITENAKALNVPMDVEAARVVAHGVLHMIGFGDKTDAEKAEMRKRENEVLKYLGYEA